MPHTPDQALHELREIRSLMERSRRFISLSGLSGIGAGCFGLLGAAVAYAYLQAAGGWNLHGLVSEAPHPWGIAPTPFLLLNGLMVLAGALSTAIYFTLRRARRQAQLLWSHTARQLTINLALPLLAGGMVCFALLYHQLGGLIAPVTLVFYGLALINGSKFTLNEIWYLGLLEVALGLFSFFFVEYGLWCWALGFGLLHIVYGWAMHRKYEQNESYE